MLPSLKYYKDLGYPGIFFSSDLYHVSDRSKMGSDIRIHLRSTYLTQIWYVEDSGQIILVHDFLQTSDVVREQKLGLGSGTKNIRDYPTGFGFLRVKVRVLLGSGSSFRGQVWGSKKLWIPPLGFRSQTTSLLQTGRLIAFINYNKFWTEPAVYAWWIFLN